MSLAGGLAVLFLATSCSLIPHGQRARVRNDLGRPVEITLCPHQECTGGKVITVKTNQVLRVPAHRSDRPGDTPDSIEVSTAGAPNRCLLLLMPPDSQQVMSLSEADERTC